MRFFPRDKGKMALFEGFSLKTFLFPVSRGKNRMSQGVENRGSVISVPWALRASTVFFFFFRFRSQFSQSEQFFRFFSNSDLLVRGFGVGKTKSKIDSDCSD